MTNPGIDAISFYVPQLYVSIEDLAIARDIAYEKLNKGLGLNKMAILDIDEDASTLAANAILKLISDFDVNPNDIGRIYMGTESAVDGSKPTATYAVEIVENALAKQYGSRSFKNCDVVDMTFACVGALDAMHNSIDWVRSGENRQAIVVASDVSKYELNSTGEYTQGAGAVAVLIKNNPSILEIDSSWGIGFKSEGDFFKPRRHYSKLELVKSIVGDLNSTLTDDELLKLAQNTDNSFWSDSNKVVEVFKEEPVFDGQFSNQCYSDRVTEALQHFKSQQAIDFEKDWNHLIFHLPYAYHGRRIIFNNWLSWIKENGSILQLEEEIGPTDFNNKDWSKKAYKSKMYTDFVSRKIAPGELASSQIGNMYTASIFMAFLSLLSNAFNSNTELNNHKIGFIGYGSGSKSKVFQGTIQSSWKTKLQSVNLFETLEQRQKISIDTYEAIHNSLQKEAVSNSKTARLSHIENEATNIGLRRYTL